MTFEADKKNKFSIEEKKAIAGLSLVIGMRVLGLMLLIPIFSVYVIALPGSTPFLAGLAFGIYGLTQAVLQIPFGYFSDRFGRKPVVTIGLGLFAIGSVLAALTSNIYVLITARLLQGAGAIASTCFAWIADLTSEDNRNIAMAFMGISVGSGVMLGMVFGPLISGITGVPFLFWIAAGLSFLAITITIVFLKEPVNIKKIGEEPELFTISKIWKCLSDPDLLKLNISGFIVNLSMITTFFSLPLTLSKYFSSNELWEVYLPLCLIGSLAMMLCARWADSMRYSKNIIIASLVAMAAAFLLLSTAQGIRAILVGFIIFFAGFSVLEAVLPSAVSKLATPSLKGSIVGTYNFSQFMGTFMGGIFAGIFHNSHKGMMFLILTFAAIVSSLLIHSTKRIR